MDKTIRRHAPDTAKTGKPRSRGDRVFDFTVYFLLCLVLIIILYPLYFVLIASFSDPLEVIAGNVSFLPVRANLESYRLVFKNSQVMTGYRNTILYTLAGTSLNILMSICAAYPLSRPKLKGKGFNVYYLSNYSEHLMRVNPSVLDFLPHMDGGVFSCYVKKIKPDSGIYQCLLEKYGLRAEECLFFDDREENVAAARELGIQAVQFETYEQAKAVTDSLK